MNRIGTCFVLLLLCCGSAFAQVVDAAVCDVLANPASFDGKVIRLKNATVVAGFDQFLIVDSGCTPSAAIWLAYPEGTKGKAGPAAFVWLQVAKNGAAVVDVPKRTAVTLQRNGDFKRFDSLLATPYKACLGCSRYSVSATLVGRLDGVSVAGVVRDKSGKVTGLSGFGNLNLYRARLVLQSVSDVVPHEFKDAKTASAAQGDSRPVGSAPDADQLKRAIAAFGAEGEDNGVTVGFGIANEVPPGEGANSSSDSPDGILFHSIFDMDRLKEENLSRAMAHVGTHIADVRGGVLMQGMEEAESRAWQATSLK